MNIGLGGVLFLWTHLILRSYVWPVILVSIFILLMRRFIINKGRFFLMGIGLCYLIDFVVSLLGRSLLASTHAIEERVELTLVIKIIAVIVSTITLVLLSRKFRNSGGTISEKSDGGEGKTFRFRGG